MNELLKEMCTQPYWVNIGYTFCLYLISGLLLTEFTVRKLRLKGDTQ